LCFAALVKADLLALETTTAAAAEASTAGRTTTAASTTAEATTAATAAEATTATATETTTTTTAAAATTKASTTAATAATTTLLGLALSSKVETDGTGTTALTNVATVLGLKGRLGLLDAVEGDVTETLAVARLTIDDVSSCSVLR
jgi:hypothetical protein